MLVCYSLYFHLGGLNGLNAFLNQCSYQGYFLHSYKGLADELTTVLRTTLKDKVSPYGLAMPRRQCKGKYINKPAAEVSR